MGKRNVGSQLKLTNVLAGLKLRVLLAGQDTEGMGTEVVTLEKGR